MATGEDYVDGGIQWGRLVQHSVGSIILSWVFLAGDWIGFVGGAVSTAIGSLGTWLEELIYQIVTLPSDGMVASWQTAAEFIGSFGLAGYVVAVILVVLTLEVAVSTLGNYVGWS